MAALCGSKGKAPTKNSPGRCRVLTRSGNSQFHEPVPLPILMTVWALAGRARPWRAGRPFGPPAHAGAEAWGYAAQQTAINRLL
jgi:hypothetical protein